MAKRGRQSAHLRMVVLVTVALVGAATACGGPPSARRPALLAMVGSQGAPVDRVDDSTVHDPSIAETDGAYYLFSTGVLDPQDPGGIAVHRSAGSLAGPWESLGAIALPQWTRGYAVNHLWAPHVTQSGATYYLYYAASSFGSNHSAIGVASTKTPGDLTSWVDHGPIITSDTADDFNAIDPMVVRAQGHWWITYGSFWSGIKLRRLLDMTHADDAETYSLAARPSVQNGPIEAPAILEHDGWFYLFVSWDYCCKGTESTYRTVVGRSKDVTGPYLDRDGALMSDGGGTTALESAGNQVGPGGGDVFQTKGTAYYVHHYYDARVAGTPTLQVREITWMDGWPHL